MTEAALADRLDIYDVINRYSHNYDGGDVDALADLFVENGVLDFDPPIAGTLAHFEGREEIRTALKTRRATQSKKRRHIFTNVVFDELSATTASIRSYLLLTDSDGGHLKPIATGVYVDSLVKTQAGWRISHRMGNLDYVVG
jgi:ketosteroid isomerase-like protein